MQVHASFLYQKLSKNICAVLLVGCVLNVSGNKFLNACNPF